MSTDLEIDFGLDEMLDQDQDQEQEERQQAPAWEALQRDDFRSYLRFLGRHKLGRAAIQLRFCALRTFYRFLMRQGAVDSSPIKNLALPKVGKRLPKFLTPQQMADLLTAPLKLLPGPDAKPPALSASWLTLRVFEDVPLGAIGLWWNSASRRNLVLGLAGGAGVASLALVLPLATGAAVLVVRGGFEPGSVVFVFFCLAAGALAEEIIFRGYVLQVLVRGIGPWAAVIPLGVLFGLTHDFNPGANALGLLNTAGFGIAFGYAYLRSRDLWLPVGLHFAWNLTLVLFGTRLSGNTIFVTGREMTWRAGALWSGGEYGPEASILTSLALIPLFVFLWKAPIRRQYSPLMDPTRENAKCEPSPLPPS